MNQKISIIMPVYNTGRYLKEALDSIFAQTFQDFELICVDDCSTDQLTLDVLSQYEQKYSNMYVIHFEKNKGAAKARNAGLYKAKGTYVIFLDADDVFDLDLLSELYRNISVWNADICVCASAEFIDDIQHIETIYRVKEPEQHKGIPFTAADVVDDIFGVIPGVPWNRLCSRRFLEENQIEFQSLTSSNDTYFAHSCVLLADKIICASSDRPLVYYRVGRENSISHNRNPFNFFKAFYKIKKQFDNRLKASHARALDDWLICGSASEIRRCEDENICKQYYKFISDYIKINIVYDSLDSIKTKSFWKCFATLDYNVGWIDLIGDYEGQLEQNREILLDEIGQGKLYIVLWGNGKRGNAFQSFCRSNGIEHLYVTDSKDENIGMSTAMNFPIVSTEIAFDKAEVVVASNFVIYEELRRKCSLQGRKCINLQKYCLLD